MELLEQIYLQVIKEPIMLTDTDVAFWRGMTKLGLLE